MATLDVTLVSLRQALRGPRQQQGWNWLVRQRMSAVKDALLQETNRPGEAWLTARAGIVRRDRNALLTQLTELGPLVLEGADLEPVLTRLQRLVLDLEHHRQRVSDLVYDSVALELGGSE
jgi:ribonuclease D